MLQNAASDVTIALILIYLMLSLLYTVIMDLDAGRVYCDHRIQRR
jgi:hypothetical protein